MATVEDQHAGMSVQCPKCGGAIAVPGKTAPAPVPGAAPATAAQFSSANFMANLERLAGNAQAKLFLWIGLGCLAGLVLFTFLPWVVGFLGVSFGIGVVQLLLSLAAIAFVIVAILLNHAQLFNIALWSAAGWSAIAALWRLIDVIRTAQYGAGGVGLYFSLLAALGAAGVLGFISVQRLMKK